MTDYNDWILKNMKSSTTSSSKVVQSKSKYNDWILANLKSKAPKIVNTTPATKTTSVPQVKTTAYNKDDYEGTIMLPKKKTVVVTPQKPQAVLSQMTTREVEDAKKRTQEYSEADVLGKKYLEYKNKNVISKIYSPAVFKADTGKSEAQIQIDATNEKKAKEDWIKNYIVKKTVFTNPTIANQYKFTDLKSIKVEKPELVKEAEKAFVTEQVKQYETYLEQEEQNKENWIKVKLGVVQTGEDINLKIFPKASPLVPYGLLKIKYPKEVADLEKQYTEYKRNLLPEGKIIEQMKLQNAAIDKRLIDEKQAKMNGFERYVDDTYRNLKDVAGETIDPALTGFAEGLTGLNLSNSNVLEDSPTLMSKILKAGGSLAGFIVGLKAVQAFTAPLKIEQVFAKLSKSSKIIDTLSALTRSSADFTILGQAHAFARNETLVGHLKSAGIDAASGGIYSEIGMITSKLPSFLKPLVEAGLWTGISRAQGASWEDAMIQGGLMGALSVFHIDIRKTSAEKILDISRRTLDIKEGASDLEIQKAFEKKTENLTINSKEYQEADAARILIEYYRQGVSITARDYLRDVADENSPTERVKTARDTLDMYHAENVDPVLNYTNKKGDSMMADVVKYPDGKWGYSVEVKTDQSKLISDFSRNELFSTKEEATIAAKKQIGEWIGEKQPSSDEVTRESLNEMVQKLIPTPVEKLATEKTVQFESQEQAVSAKTRMDELINKEFEYLKESAGKGVTQGGLARDTEGKVVGRFGRQSNNEQWYRDYFAKNGKAPSQKAMREIAIDRLTNGYEKEGLPPNKEFIELQKMVETMNRPEVSPTVSIKESTSLDGEASRVFERLQEEYPEALKGELSYDPIKLKDDAERAVEIVAKDKEMAYRLAMRIETSNEVTSTAVNIALANKALAEGNYALYSQLVKSRSLALTRMGQEIVSEKGSVSDNDTSRYVKELVSSRLDNLGSKYLQGIEKVKGVSVKEKAMKVIEKEVEKATKTIKNKELDLSTAQEIIDKLTC